ncbi:hypothetical protein C8Q76DRAFT_758922, partial [Earliella scabrosa]
MSSIPKLGAGLLISQVLSTVSWCSSGSCTRVRSARQMMVCEYVLHPLTDFFATRTREALLHRGSWRSSIELTSSPRSI